MKWMIKWVIEWWRIMNGEMNDLMMHGEKLCNELLNDEFINEWWIDDFVMIEFLW